MLSLPSYHWTTYFRAMVCKMGPLAKPAIEAVKNKETRFIPERYEKRILIGWKISKIGAFQGKYGGDIEFQHIIDKDCNQYKCVKSKNQKMW